MTRGISVDEEALARFCQAHGIMELALFGSVLRDDFTEDSDVDMLVRFRPGMRVGLIKLAEIEAGLSRIVERRVDLRTPAELSRYFREQVVRSAAQIYAQGCSDALAPYARCPR
ncbi:MAG: nucleotidyltransferase domain-containing protein [Thermaerobacter sp.]|nr:nucleotidyltransferase domain-containing protein [Thermaerobacter sp.]